MSRKRVSTARAILIGVAMNPLIWISASWAQFGGSGGPSSSSNSSTNSSFENPPLRYWGPDPTERRFVPGLIVSGQTDTALQAGPSNSSPSDVVLWDQSQSANSSWGDASVIDEFPLGTDWMPYEIPVMAKPISEFKDGFFQKLSLSGAWMDRRERDSFGLTEVDLFATFALPAPVREWPMLISPTYNIRYLNGPSTPALPSRLHEAFVDFVWIPRFGDRLIGIIGVAPSVYSDFEASDADGFRLTGKGLVRYDIVPDRLQLLAGVLYLNRDDVKILPAGGFFWNPNDDWNLELIFPKPKIARRLIYTGEFEDWLYVGGEFGGNSYSVERLPGVNDKLTLFDMRVYIGLERKRDGGAGRKIEIGYVFNREAEYLSGAAKFDAADTVIIRAGVAF